VAEGKASVAAYFAVQSFDNTEIAELLDVGDRTVSQYTSDFKPGARWIHKSSSDNSLSTTAVPQYMSTETPEDSEMVKLNVKVPEPLLDEIDELAGELKYTNRSEFVREVLRDTTEPILTPGAKEGIAQGYADVAAGRTMTHEEMKEKYDVDD